MDGQQAMMNQLIMFVLLEKLLDDRGRAESEDRDTLREILPFLLITNMGAAGQVQTAAATSSGATPASGGWDANSPMMMFMLLLLLGRRRTAERSSSSKT